MKANCRDVTWRTWQKRRQVRAERKRPPDERHIVHVVVACT